jgi:hypothetical protein
MDDLGLAFDGPIPVAEDNAARCIIAHTGKLTHNMRHIALKMISLQTLQYFAPLVPPTTKLIIVQKPYLNLLITITAVTSRVYVFSQLFMLLLLLIPYCLPNYLFIFRLSWIFPQLLTFSLREDVNNCPIARQFIQIQFVNNVMMTVPEHFSKCVHVYTHFRHPTKT